ncbi:MAG: hypothetical protein WCR54_02630 [Clostridia bacterium]
MSIAYILTRTHKIDNRLMGKYKYINQEKPLQNGKTWTVLGDNNEIFRAKFYQTNNDHKYIILVPSYLGNNESTNYACKLFLEKGYNCLAINNRGTSKKTGKSVTFGFYENYDLQKWFNYLLNYDNEAEVGLFGEGMGASTALMCAGDIPEIKFVISYNAYFSMEKLIDTKMEKYKIFIGPTKWFLRHFIKVYVEQLNPDIWAKKAEATIVIINDESKLIDSKIQNEYIKEINNLPIKIVGEHLMGLRNNPEMLLKALEIAERSNKK